MEWEHTVGLALAVIKEGHIVYTRGYGLANIEHQVPVKPETVFPSASVGKQFTATAVMMLVEEGKISLEDKITKFFTNAPESWKGISVRHLLTHTSGMGEFPGDQDYTRISTEEELIKKVMAIPLEFSPGEKYAYSNLGYVTLGLLIGKVTGAFYGDFLRERIFKPLDMSTARIDSAVYIVTNRAAPYWRPGDSQPWHNVKPSWPSLITTTADGSLLLTVYDMAKWDAALYKEKLLRKSSLDEMWTPVKTKDGQTHPYGFGWSLGNVNGHPIVEHGGAIMGIRACIVRYLDQKLTVVVFANSRTDVGKIAHRVASFYRPELTPPSRVAIEDKEPSMTALVRTLIQGLIGGKADSDFFTPGGRADFFPIQAKQISKRMDALGKLCSVEFVSRMEYGTEREIIYRLVFKRLVLICDLGVTKENKISWISVAPE
jgi:D-alanyl-D-alanine carboxypeptidase